ncbi:glycine N-acyltransferase-like protein 3 isoform X1 [Conger conger]|uniref:glycine N-acyltransferase-like protein 3 isoform X1 n=1 Tax=Conger conger TaxID=82655 RepID=UPI002A59B3DF|nr:glycine N-acyltransferase-like protein 3 isoform X1 [Conger conger]
MFVLGAEELKSAERILKGLFPESLKVYGCLFNINRGKPYIWEVIADSWPDFKAIICKPNQQCRQDYRDREATTNMCHVYSRDQDSLLKLLSALLDWSQYTLLAGIDVKYLDAVKELAARNNTPTRMEVVMVVMTLDDVSHLKGPDSDLVSSRLKPLTAAFADLVDSRGKFKCRESYNSVLTYISDYPSLSVRGPDGAPVSWVLLYHHGALGRLHTEPQHREQGHARTLLCAMARELHAQGRPVYGFVEEGNAVSLSLFTSLGFTHQPDYRPVWLVLNPEKQASQDPCC